MDSQGLLFVELLASVLVVQVNLTLTAPAPNDTSAQTRLQLLFLNRKHINCRQEDVFACHLQASLQEGCFSPAISVHKLKTC